MRIRTGLILWGLAGAGLILGFGQDKPSMAADGAPGFARGSISAVLARGYKPQASGELKARPLAEKAAAAKASKPLIRMDLLQKRDREIAFAKRDIFIPENGLGSGGMLSAPPGVRMTKAGAGGESVAPEPQALSLNVRYLGFIQTKQKMTALVLFEGQAVAVAEGDMLGPAWKVVKISAGLIEIQGEDGKSQTFALEGERK